MVEMRETLVVTDRRAWRAWLEAHHQDKSEVWLVFNKAHTGRPSIPYEDAVEEALCFGWVDSLIQKIDEERYARKFTPRVNSWKWSASNVRRMEKMIAEGRVTEAGLAVYDPAADAQSPAERVKDLGVPAFVEAGLRASPAAWEHFNALPPSHRRAYVGWIMDAKREETRARRLAEAIGLLERGERLGMK